jgi:hypothetical protein
MGSGVLALALVLVASMLMLARSWKTGQTRRLLRNVEHSDIGKATEGPVKIRGTLSLADASLRAPLSGRTCAVYDAVVVEEGEGADVIIHERRACDFLLVDGTGTALVRAGAVEHGSPGSQLELAIVQDRKYSSGTFNDASPELEQFLASRGQKSKGLLLNRPLTYREGVFEPGERVVVYGRGRREPDPDAAADGFTYRERPTRLVIEPLAGKIYLSDDPSVVGVSALPQDHPGEPLKQARDHRIALVDSADPPPRAVASVDRSAWPTPPRSSRR